MRNHRIPSEFDQLVRHLESCFSSRSAGRFATLVIVWVVYGGRRAISRVLVAILIGRIDSDLEVATDDTLCRRREPHFFGAAMHRDGASSSCSGATGARPAFAFGHNWVVLSIALSRPWSEHQKMATPVMFRL